MFLVRWCVMLHNKPFNENASKQRWHGLANYARPLTGRYVSSKSHLGLESVPW
jgi:hypothetical protein